MSIFSETVLNISVPIGPLKIFCCCAASRTTYPAVKIENSGMILAMSAADTVVNSRLPRAMAAGSAPCLNRLAFRLICTSNSPGALLSNASLNTVHILACQSSGTAGLEMRSSALLCDQAGRARLLLAARAARTARRRRWLVWLMRCSSIGMWCCCPAMLRDDSGGSGRWRVQCRRVATPEHGPTFHRQDFLVTLTGHIPHDAHHAYVGT